MTRSLGPSEVLLCGVILGGALRSARYYRTVQYVFQRDEERHQSNPGIELETFSTGLRDAE